MDSFGLNGLPPFWDFNQSPNSFSHLADDDFLALLQRQFPPDLTSSPLNSFSIPHNAVAPTKLNNLPPTAPPPPLSDDSSPSPPSVNEPSSSRRQSGVYNASPPGEIDDALKRKASEDDLEEGPSHKSQHLG